MKEGVSDSRYVIEKGKSIVIMGLFQWLAAACLGGNMPTLTSASVWLVGGHCPGQCCCVLVPSHPCCFWNRTANIDRRTPILCLSPAAALSTVLLRPRDICLVRCQTCCMQDNWVVLSLPDDRWQSTKSQPVTLRAFGVVTSTASTGDKITPKIPSTALFLSRLKWLVLIIGMIHWLTDWLMTVILEPCVLCSSNTSKICS